MRLGHGFPVRQEEEGQIPQSASMRLTSGKRAANGDSFLVSSQIACY
jgi:hypothetical protein